MTNKQPLPVEEMLSARAPSPLTPLEQEKVWLSVSSRIAAGGAVPSPYWYSIILNHKTMIPLIVALVVLLGAGGTVAASDDARPGDFLFPVDRAVEDVRLALAQDDDKADLRMRFTNERFNEFSSVVDDELGSDDVSGTLTSAEADIFTNETIVKLEINDRKVIFSTDALAREDIVAEIADRYGFTEAEVDALLVIESEDRASRSDDGVQTPNSSRGRIENALLVLSSFITDTRDSASTSPEVVSALRLLEDRLLERAGSLPSDLRVKIRGDRSRIEVRGEDGRFRIESKNGEIRFKSDDDDHDRGFGNDDSDDDENEDDENDDDSALEIEADVFTDITTVKVELNDQKFIFTTDETTRTNIIAEIEDRFSGLSTDEIDDALVIEIEDRASRTKDHEISGGSDDDSDDDSDEDDSDDDSDDSDDDSGSDDDSDDDDDSGSDSSGSGSSGHGGGDD